MKPTVDSLNGKGAGTNFSSSTLNSPNQNITENITHRGITFPRAVGFAAIVITLASCAPAVASSPDATQSGSPTLAAPASTETVQNPAQIEATATPKIEISMPAPIEGLFYGSYGVDSGNQQVITGAINPADFEASNPNSPYTVPSYGNGEVQVNTLYSATNTETPSATMLDQKWLDGYLKAQTDKTGVTTGTLPDGSPVTKQGLFWVDGAGNILNPFVRNIAGQNFGWPMLAVKDNQLFTAVVDGDGKLVGNEQFHPAFQTPQEMATSVGFDKTQNVARVALSQSGILQMFDAQGTLLGEVPYLGTAQTFEQRVATAEYVTPTIYDEVIGQYAKAFGLEVKNIQLHTEEFTDKRGNVAVVQVDQNGVPLFIFDSTTSKWRTVGYRDISPANFQVGASLAVWTGDLDSSDPRYKQIYAQNFEIVATDGSLSEYDLWDTVPADATVTPQEAIAMYDWTDFDKIAKYAVDHNLPLRAMHAFLSPVIDNNTPNWLSKMTDEQLREYIKLHITAVMSRANFAEASVANEAFFGAGIPGNQFFYKRLGEEYIRLAFQTAHEVSPNTVLILNDNIVYGPHGDGSDDGVWTNSVQNGESDAIFKFVKREVANGLPIGGVGIESHLVASDFISGDPDANVQIYQQQLTALMAKYNEINVNVYITELDVNMVGLPNDWTQQQKEAFKAKIFGAVFRSCLASPNCKSVTMWGFTNHATWELTPGYPYGAAESPLPLDDNYGSTASDFEIKKALFESIAH